MSEESQIQNDVVSNLAKISIPSNVIEVLDFNHLQQRIKETFEDIDSAGKNLEEMQNAHWWKKILYRINGKATETLAEAIKVQGELAKEQMALSVLNALIAKELYKSQKELERLSTQIIEQNMRLEKQNQELIALTQQSIQQQKTIMELVDLTKEQEEAIHYVLEKAKKINEYEEGWKNRLSEHDKNIASFIEKTGGEIKGHADNITDHQSKIDELIGELRKANDVMEGINTRLKSEEEEHARLNKKLKNTVGWFVLVTVLIIGALAYGYYRIQKNEQGVGVGAMEKDR